MKKRHLIIQIMTISALLGLQSAQAMYVGASVGYMIDSEEEILAVQVGTQVSNSGSMSHNIELELAYADASDYGIDVEMMPLMVNYKAINSASEKMDVYFGAGAGMTKVDVSGYGMSDDDTVFTLQALVGLEFSFSPTGSLRLGYRYVYLDTVELIGEKIDDLDDSVVEVGVVFRF